MGGGGGGSFWLMYRVSVWKDEDVLEVDGVDGCTTVKMYIRALKCIF